MPPICAEWMRPLASTEAWRVYVAFAEGKPVGAGALCIQGSVGWLSDDRLNWSFEGEAGGQPLLESITIDLSEDNWSCASSPVRSRSVRVPPAARRTVSTRIGATRAAASIRARSSLDRFVMASAASTRCRCSQPNTWSARNRGPPGQRDGTRRESAGGLW